MSNYMKLAILLAGCYGAYKFSGNSAIKTAAVAIAATQLAKQVPVVDQFVV